MALTWPELVALRDEWEQTPPPAVVLAGAARAFKLLGEPPPRFLDDDASPDEAPRRRSRGQLREYTREEAVAIFAGAGLGSGR